MTWKSVIVFYIIPVIFLSCGLSAEKETKKIDAKPFVVHQPYALEEDIQEVIEEILETELSLDTPQQTKFNNLDVLAAIYKQNNYQRLWSTDSAWYVRADSFYNLITEAEYYGLFLEDYHLSKLSQLKKALSNDHKNATLWSNADMLFSDAFISFAHDLHVGRIPKDSVSLHGDSLVNIDFYRELFAKVIDTTPRAVLEKLEPKHPAYQKLRSALPAFVKKMNRTANTYISFPKTDSILFVRQLQQRLFEEGLVEIQEPIEDTATFTALIKKAQKHFGLTVDGKAGAQLVGKLNNTDLVKFKRIAINLDRLKQLPDSMPVSYILVNLPAYKLEVYDSGRVILESKVIVGQPKTRTPILNSKLSNMITYPQWTVPYSIIFKEMLPKIRKDVNYLKKENLMVVDKYDSVIDPGKIDWNKLSKTNFPYLLRQRQGDDNSLGVIKFNFINKFSVYMHDTNARSLFSRNERALSHGCVRVQAWDSLSRYLLARDSANISVDTLKVWLLRQEKHHIPLRKKPMVYFRYYTTIVRETGEIGFLEDIYFEDNYLITNYLNR